ncbi:MAG: iron-sulfur cluster assembly scaffold protein [Candidatus Brocadiae bacterium]|nr:iron-sulfur cluster assembly scaffold protein [Candidatus Brocadiia bacterium]
MEYKRPEQLEGKKIQGHAGKPAGQGPFIIVYLVIKDGRIEDNTYQTYGCPACIACSEEICKLSKGKSLEEAREIGRKDLEKEVGSLPRSKQHCIEYALEALINALGKIEKADSKEL